MTISASMVWEVRSTGSVTLNGGGGFNPSASGVDYSQQNAVQYALTGVTTAGVSDTMLTTSASVDMIGNTCQITSGTNFTIGFYEIIAAVAGVSIQVDRNCATGVGAAGVVKIGGATATLGSIGAATAIQAGNKVWVRGTFSVVTDTIATTTVQGLGVIIEGYGTTRGDGYLGRTNTSGPLILTNMPTITYSGGQRFNATAAYLVLRYINLVSNNTTASATITGVGTIYDSCNVTNNNVTNTASCLSLGTAGSLAINCDIALPSGVAGSFSLGVAQTLAKAIGCRITNAGGYGVFMSVAGTISNCLVYNCGQVGIGTATITSQVLINNNTIVGNVGDGINILTGGTTLNATISGNMITDNGGFGINMVSTGNAAQIINNRFRDNTSGNIGNSGGYTTATTKGSVTSGNGTTDYVNAAGGDYSLVPTSPAANAAFPYAASMGAYQLPAGGGGSSVISYFG